MEPAKPPRLVKGVDFYMEGSKLVFTAAYHLKRGHCCNSRCRHCPYGSDGGLTAKIQLVGAGEGSSRPAMPETAPIKRPA